MGLKHVFLGWSKTKRRRVTGRIAWSSLGAALPLLIIGTVSMILNRQTPLGYTNSGNTIRWLSPSVTRYHDMVDLMAQRYNISPQLIDIIMTLESGGDPTADSGQANGLMQITPYTAKDIASKYLEKPLKVYDLKDPRTNIEFGAAYLSYLRTTFCDHSDGPSWNACVEAIAAGYNGGPGAAINLIEGRGLTDTQTVIYSRNAFNMWRERKATVSPTYDRWREAGGQTLLDSASK